MKINMFYCLLFLTGIIISSFAQLLLKKSAIRKYDSKFAEYFNFKTIFAYFIFFLATIFSVISYKKIPLSLGTLLSVSEYIFIAILSYFILKEKINFKKIIGLIFIILGIILFIV